MRTPQTPDHSPATAAADSFGDPGDLLAGLNPQQKDAVTHRGVPLLIVAGAGSGKTAVLTRRIAYLLAHGGAHPGEILAITFTNKAAAEMRERVTGLVGPQARAMWVSTFHSTCVRILRAQSGLLQRRNSNFSIYDSDDSRRLFGFIVKEKGLDLKAFAPRQVAASVSNWKNELISPAAALTAAQEDNNQRDILLAEIYEIYQARLAAANALDFDDLIGEVVALFTRHPDVAEYYRRRFRHILIDEYQDTNHAQYMFVSTLVGQAGGTTAPAGDPWATQAVAPSELCVVGDADQSIYAFRGATIRNIEDFEQDYPQARTILLEQNYRSTQTILQAANAVIARNQGRREKKLWTDHGDGDEITGYIADNEHDEARFIMTQIEELTAGDTYTFGEMAVFYRTNNASRPLEEMLIRLGIPYKVVGGTRFY